MHKYLLATHRAINLTPKRFEILKKGYQNDWKKVWRQVYAKKKENINPDKILQDLEDLNIKTYILGEPDYPLSLANIKSPPVVLFCRGEIQASDFPSISVVGSRKISNYGKRALEDIVSEIARSNITIISGIALGADTLAHKIAIENNTKTMAVLGNGIDHIYPKFNEKWAEKAFSEGRLTLLSEHWPGVKARAEFFPMRNRIVTGLSIATLIIEAAEKSGSLISAGMALDQNRDLFAVPGEIFSPQSAGTNRLLAETKAQAAISGSQILEMLGLQKNHSQQKALKQELPTTGVEAELLQLFKNENSLHVNEIIRRAPFESHVTSATLSLMEIKGWVKNIGHQEYAQN